MVKKILFLVCLILFVKFSFASTIRIPLHKKISFFSKDTLLIGCFNTNGKNFQVSIWCNKWGNTKSMFYKKDAELTYNFGITDSVRRIRISFVKEKNVLFSLYNQSFKTIQLDAKNSFFEIEELPQKIKTELDLIDSFPNLSKALAIQGSYNEITELIKAKKYKHYYINLWATYCHPCIEHFKELPKFDNYNTLVINLCAGAVDTTAQNIIRRLKPTGFNFYCERGFLDDINMNSGFPSGALYDANGELEKFYNAGFSAEAGFVGKDENDVFRKLESEKINGK